MGEGGGDQEQKEIEVEMKTGSNEGVTRGDANPARFCRAQLLLYNFLVSSHCAVAFVTFSVSMVLHIYLTFEERMTTVL